MLQSISLSIQQETVSPDLKAPFPFLSHATSEYNYDNRWQWRAGQQKLGALSLASVCHHFLGSGALFWF